MSKTVEFRVIPVTRYIVTEHTEYSNGSKKTEEIGEFKNYGMAERTAARFSRAEASDVYAVGCEEETLEIRNHDGRIWEKNQNGTWVETLQQV